MSETVYLLGAGINRILKNDEGLQPPLATDFFKQILSQNRFKMNEYVLEELKPLFDYIERYWKLSIEQLKKYPFDLEACFTLIQLQKLDAEKNGDTDTFRFLSQIELQLTKLLAKYLAEFNLSYDPRISQPFHFFGNIIYNQKATVITFNYDTLLEYVIGNASDSNPNIPATFIDTSFRRIKLPDEEVAFSHLNWNLPLAYGIKFDEVQLQRAGMPIFVSGERFYSHPKNKIYENPILKLHGSVNWFTYSGIKKPSGSWLKHYGVEADFPHDVENAKDRVGQTILFKANWWNDTLPEHNDELVNPVIITPVLYKNFYEHSFINEIWKRAAIELSNCKRLIVGGYSFPPTDFNTKRLFLESFSNHTPEEIIVINPETSVVQIVKDLCHFKKPVLACRDLNEFIALY
jgi:hypothetical protein